MRTEIVCYYANGHEHYLITTYANGKQSHFHVNGEGLPETAVRESVKKALETHVPGYARSNVVVVTSPPDILPSIARATGSIEIHQDAKKLEQRLGLVA